MEFLVCCLFVSGFGARSDAREVEQDPAWRAGLRTGDIITSLDGHTIASRPELSAALDDIEPGSTVDLGWTTAAGRQRTGTVTVTASAIN